jgi:hypothetical protein
MLKSWVIFIYLTYILIRRYTSKSQSCCLSFIVLVQEAHQIGCQEHRYYPSSDGTTPKVPAEPWKVKPSGLFGPVRLLFSREVEVKY